MIGIKNTKTGKQVSSINSQQMLRLAEDVANGKISKEKVKDIYFKYDYNKWLIFLEILATIMKLIKELTWEWKAGTKLRELQLHINRFNEYSSMLQKLLTKYDETYLRFIRKYIKYNDKILYTSKYNKMMLYNKLSNRYFNIISNEEKYLSLHSDVYGDIQEVRMLNDMKKNIEMKIKPEIMRMNFAIVNFILGYL